MVEKIFRDILGERLRILGDTQPTMLNTSTYILAMVWS